MSAVDKVKLLTHQRLAKIAKERKSRKRLRKFKSKLIRVRQMAKSMSSMERVTKFLMLNQAI
jgi:hypothetical protein